MSEPLLVRGIAAGAGICVGRAVLLDGRAGVPLRYVPESMLELETERLRRASHASLEAVVELRAGIAGETGESAAALLDPLVQMHEDPMLLERAVDIIRAQGVNAEQAVVRAAAELSTSLLGSSSGFFRERAEDVRHVARHLVHALRGARRRTTADEPPIVLVADALSPAELASHPRDRLLGVVTTTGSGTSHTALLARSLGIPAVVGARALPLERVDGSTLVVDGLRGVVVLEPDEATVVDAHARADRFAAFAVQLEARRDLPVATTDGVEIDLRANLEMASDAEDLVRHGIGGVGLFRTEYLVLAHGRVPDEAEQTRVYEGVVRALEGRPLVLRTFDLGGDKHAHASLFGRSLGAGFRARAGLRRALENPTLLEPQLRAAVRAAAHGPVSILLPQVSGVAEAEGARALLDRVRAELAAEGEPVAEVPMGIMIEVPSAALLAEQLARRVDFFAVGTNDLSQFTLAIDRSDAHSAEALDGLDPSVLELVGRALRAARLAGIPCSICGDLAADPVAIPLLLGLGATAFSVPRDRVPEVAEVIRRVSATDARVAVERALEAATSADVRALALARFAPRLADLWVEHGIDVG